MVLPNSIRSPVYTTLYLSYTMSFVMFIESSNKQCSLLIVTVIGFTPPFNLVGLIENEELGAFSSATCAAGESFVNVTVKSSLDNVVPAAVGPSYFTSIPVNGL